VQRYLVDRGSGAPVILIHGLGGSADWWRHNVDTLAREFRIIALDLIGFGRNRLFLRRSKLPLKFDEIAALLIRWNSMGGHVAIDVAAARPLLRRLSRPVLLLWGERDPLVPLVYAEQMQSADASSVFSVLSVVKAFHHRAHRAHACHFTFPEETASVATEKLFDGVAGDQNDQRDREGDHRNDPLTGAAGDSK
jgi:pimeloyl-ACP methyl ester carboxylesterase